MHPLVKLAKDTIELYVNEGRVLPVRDEELTPEMKAKAGQKNAMSRKLTAKFQR